MSEHEDRKGHIVDAIKADIPGAIRLCADIQTGRIDKQTLDVLAWALLGDDR